MNTTTTNFENELQNLRLKHGAANAQAEALRVQMAPMQIELKKIYERQSALEKKIDELIAKSAENVEKIDWSAALSSSTTHGSYKLYQTINDRLPGLYAKGSCWVNADGGMGQRCVALMIEKSKPNAMESALSSLSEILPHIEAIEGKKKLGIFEHSLSMHASYTAEINEDHTACRITSQSYGRLSEVASFDSIEKLVQYVHDNLYYEIWSPADSSPSP
jgi:hypothetical protein